MDAFYNLQNNNKVAELTRNRSNTEAMEVELEINEKMEAGTATDTLEKVNLHLEKFLKTSSSRGRSRALTLEAPIHDFTILEDVLYEILPDCTKAINISKLRTAKDEREIGQMLYLVEVGSKMHMGEFLPVFFKALGKLGLKADEYILRDPTAHELPVLRSGTTTAFSEDHTYAELFSKLVPRPIAIARVEYAQANSNMKPRKSKRLILTYETEEELATAILENTCYGGNSMIDLEPCVTSPRVICLQCGQLNENHDLQQRCMQGEAKCLECGKGKHSWRRFECKEERGCTLQNCKNPNGHNVFSCTLVKQAIQQARRQMTRDRRNNLSMKYPRKTTCATVASQEQLETAMDLIPQLTMIAANEACDAYRKAAKMDEKFSPVDDKQHELLKNQVLGNLFQNPRIQNSLKQMGSLLRGTQHQIPATSPLQVNYKRGGQGT